MSHGWKLVDLPKICDARGNLTFIEKDHLPFSIKRVYYLYDVPGGAVRAGHAHKALQQVIIAISGSFDVALENGQGSREKFYLNRPYRGLYIPSMIWRDIDNFSSGAVCLVLASAVYDESDYYRNYDDFLAAVGKG